MSEVEENKTIDTPTATNDTQDVGISQSPSRTKRNFRPREGGNNNRRGGDRGGFREREKPEFEQKAISIRRVTRVMAGGRRFSFSVAMIIGNKKGSIGVGLGKASDTALAMQKAFRDAKKNMITVPFTKDGSIAHQVDAKFCSSRVSLMPNYGRGTVAGSSVRMLIEMAGLKDVTAKVFSGSKNMLNNAQATILAFKKLPGTVALPAKEEKERKEEKPKRFQKQGGFQSRSPRAKKVEA
jgi:small subunit ribosomal protein S5